MPDAPRIPPLEPPYDPDTEAMLRRWMPPGAEVEPLALFRTLAVHEDLAARMRPLGAGILGHGRLDPRDREIVIARACARAGAEYGAMLAIALGLGSSLFWGLADFGGGLQSRRFPVIAVLLVSQAVGLAGIAVIVALSGEPAPALADLWPAAAGGAGGLLAL